MTLVRRSQRHRILGLSLGLGLFAMCEGESAASPGVEGTRNLSMGKATRGSSAGTNAALINPAGLSYSQQFAIEPLYQFDLRTRTHGLGVFLSDSLNNPRFALALGYVFMRGGPRIGYTGLDASENQLDLVHFGHEIAGVLSVAVVRNWLYFGIKPKWQYVSLRYLDDEGTARDYTPKLNAFGLDLAMAINLFNYVKVAVVGYNLVGNIDPAYREDDITPLEGIANAEDVDLDMTEVRRLSDYPLSLGHGLSVFPLARPDFSLNVDATYDFTSFWTDTDKYTRITVNAGGEFIAGPVPIRVGGWWDSRGRGGADDRGYVTAGTGYIQPAPLGGVGIDITAGFAQQVTGSPSGQLETIIGVNIGIRMRPDL